MNYRSRFPTVQPSFRQRRGSEPGWLARDGAGHGVVRAAQGSYKKHKQLLTARQYCSSPTCQLMTPRSERSNQLRCPALHDPNRRWRSWSGAAVLGVEHFVRVQRRLVLARIMSGPSPMTVYPHLRTVEAARRRRAATTRVGAADSAPRVDQHAAISGGVVYPQRLMRRQMRPRARAGRCGSPGSAQLRGSALRGALARAGRGTVGLTWLAPAARSSTSMS